jgi:hypothetical protein
VLVRVRLVALKPLAEELARVGALVLVEALAVVGVWAVVEVVQVQEQVREQVREREREQESMRLWLFWLRLRFPFAWLPLLLARLRRFWRPVWLVQPFWLIPLAFYPRQPLFYYYRKRRT